MAKKIVVYSMVIALLLYMSTKCSQGSTNSLVIQTNNIAEGYIYKNKCIFILLNLKFTKKKLYFHFFSDFIKAIVK